MDELQIPKSLKLSYAVTCCDEFEEIKTLLPFLVKHKEVEDEIVVLVDLTKNSPTSELLGYLHKLSSNGYITLVEDRFNNHFSDWKNRLTRACKGDYIINIDADEVPNLNLMKSFHAILETNPEVEMFRISRINTVEGITQNHLNKWGWVQNKQSWLNYPDFQQRIYKNNGKIKWKNKVHEVLEGYQSTGDLPLGEAYSLYHPKDISRQERQNLLYENLG